MQQNRFVLVGLGVVLIGAGAMTFFLTSRSKSAGGVGAARDAVPSPEQYRELRDHEMVGKSAEEISEDLRAAIFRDEVWRSKAGFQKIPAEDWRSVSASFQERIADPSGVVGRAEEEALAEAIARQAWLRSRPSPEQFRAWIDGSDLYDWNTDRDTIEAARRDAQLRFFYENFLERPYDPESDLQQRLSQVWEGLATHAHLFDAVGTGEFGAAILVKRIRTEGELDALGFSGKHAIDRDYWGSYGYRYGMQFTKPTRTGAEVVAEAPSVIVAFSHIIVRYGDGRLANWMTRWHLDSESGRWIYDMTQATSGMTTMVVW